MEWWTQSHTTAAVISALASAVILISTRAVFLTIRLRKSSQDMRRELQQDERAIRQTDVEFVRETYRATIKDIQDNLASLRRQVVRVEQAEQLCQGKLRDMHEQIAGLERDKQTYIDRICELQERVAILERHDAENHPGPET